MRHQKKPRPTALAVEDIEVDPVTWDVEEEQEKLMREKIGELYNVLDRRGNMEFKTIHRVEPYETQLEQYVWAQREKWAIYGTIAGSIITSVAWLIALSF